MLLGLNTGAEQSWNNTGTRSDTHVDNFRVCLENTLMDYHLQQGGLYPLSDKQSTYIGRVHAPGEKFHPSSSLASSIRLSSQSSRIMIHISHRVVLTTERIPWRNNIRKISWSINFQVLHLMQHGMKKEWCLLCYCGSQQGQFLEFCPSGFRIAINLTLVCHSYGH